ncbi:unnamed protein product [Pedinophyceae sp. YPF-701]|nr:unnamed protein product [Pedinophyceae sp. YPF-701]
MISSGGATAPAPKKIFVELDSDSEDEFIEIVNDDAEPALEDMLHQLEHNMTLRQQGQRPSGLESGLSKDPAFFMVKLRERAASAVGGGSATGSPRSDRGTPKVKTLKFATRDASQTDPGNSLSARTKRCKSARFVRGRLSATGGSSTGEGAAAAHCSAPRTFSESGGALVPQTPLTRESGRSRLARFADETA